MSILLLLLGIILLVQGVVMYTTTPQPRVRDYVALATYTITGFILTINAIY